MTTETTMKMTLLRPKRLISVYAFVIGACYVLYFAWMRQLKREVFENFNNQPESLRVLNYTAEEVEDAKLYQMELPPLRNTLENVLYRWEEGNGRYQGFKLLLLFPVTLHLCYVLFKHWSASFKAHVGYRKTRDPAQAYYAKLEVTHTTGLVHEARKVYLCKVYHYVQNGEYKQQIEFENEKYNVVRLGSGECSVERHFKELADAVPAFDKSRGLSKQEHYTQLAAYGENRITLKYPVYTRILLDELLSPYFAFQVFCSVLYALDNFAMYSLFSLVFLFFTEGANVYTKYNSLKSTCKLAPKPVLVEVLRDGEQLSLSSAQLVPGDVVIYKKEDYSSGANEDAEDAGKKEAKKPALLSPMQQMANMALFKIILKVKDAVFGKYYDEAIYKDINKLARSQIFPADMVLLRGQLISDESILTGEQASQIKEALDDGFTQEDIQPFNQIYAGTKLIQIQSDEVALLVTRTASQTEQGKLIKTIAFNEERMNITTRDSILFLGIMFVVAVFSGVYAFTRGYRNTVCKLSKLFLESLMIFVSVIPPDLPTELSMCIGNSIREMRQRKVFSTEPYRILNAGRLKYVCFDKSGTLTQSNIRVLGVDDKLAPETFKEIVDSIGKKQPLELRCAEQAKVVLACCQSLGQFKKELIGDILEINAFKAVGASFLENQEVQLAGAKFTILKRFYFNSAIKRMSVLVKTSSGRVFVVTKGSPEAIQKLLTQTPKGFDQTLTEYTKKGLRILALASKEITGEPDIQQPRSAFEQGLTFNGLLVCQTPLKKDTAASIEVLKRSDHAVKVISGDHVINVAVSSQQCGIIESGEPIMIVEKIEGTQVECRGLRDGALVTQDAAQLAKANVALCFTNSNNGLVEVLTNPKLNELFLKAKVFARTTPVQKQLIVQKYQRQPGDSKTMFVGDGVNDLNALQSADIGVALLEEQEFAVKAKQEQTKIPFPSIMEQPGNRPATYMQLVNEAQLRAQKKKTNAQQEYMVLAREQMIYKQYLKMKQANDFQKKNDLLALWTEALDTEEETQDLKMGDATIAAQFTVKSGSLEGVLDIVRQGRCALATVQMNFKTTALQCLVGAYAMTALTLNGVRSSNYQLIASNLIATMVMMNISKAKQLQQISPVKPPKTIVGLYLIFSMFAQAVIHVGCLFLVQRIAGSQMETVALATEFKPSLVNTCVFFMRMWLDVCVTLVNYPGKPHMESITQHKWLMLSVLGYLAATLFLLFELSPELNQFLGFVELPNDIRMKVIVIGTLDMVGCFAMEQVSKRLFQ